MSRVQARQPGAARCAGNLTGGGGADNPWPALRSFARNATAPALIADERGRGSGGLARASQRQIQPAPAGGIADRVAESSSHWPLDDFGSTEEGFARLIEQVHVDFFRQLRETQNWITAPVIAANAAGVVGDFFV